MTHRPLQVPDRAAGDTTIVSRIVTFNIWGLPSWITGARSGRYEEIARELDRLDADIVLLQEVWTAKACSSIPASGHWYAARAAGQHTFFQQNGLVTLSKFPILDGRFFPFARAAFPDCLVTKGALKVTVELPGGERLNLSNVHLQDAGAQRIKQSQIDQLVGLVRTAGDRQVAEIMGGDFNCTPGSPGFNSKNCLDLRYRRSRAASRSSPGITPRTCGSREKRWTTYFCATLTIGVQTPTNGLRSRTTTWIAVAPITSVSKAGWN